VPPILADRVLETSTTTGTGPFTLGGAVPGFRRFGSVLAAGDSCSYTIESVNAVGLPTGAWEVGTGTYGADDTLARTTVTASSNAGAHVAFAAGPKRVFVNVTAAAVEGKVEATELASRSMPTRGSALVGNEETASTVKSILDKRPYVENRASLRAFFKAMDKFRNASASSRRIPQLFGPSSPPTSRVGIMSWGDSVAGVLVEPIVERLFESYDFAGAFGVTPYTAFEVTMTGAVIDGSTKPILSQSAFDGSDGGADFTYLPSGNHYTLSASATITFNVGLATRFADVLAFFAIGAGFGSATVELLDETGTTVIATTGPTSLVAGALGATHTITVVPAQSASVSAAMRKFRIRVTASGGPVVLLGVMPRRASGIYYVPMARGGCSLAQNNYANKTILAYIVAQLNIGLVTLHAKEEAPSTGFPATITTLNTHMPAAAKIAMGSTPDVSSEATQKANKNLLRGQALAADWVYVDGYRIGKDYGTMNSLGAMTDGTHPNIIGSEIVGNIVWAEAGFDALYRPYSSVSPIAPEGTFYTLNALGQTGNKIPIATEFGGSDPTRAKLKCIREIKFADDGATLFVLIGAYGTNALAIYDQAGAEARLRIGQLEGVNAGQSSVAGRFIAKDLGTSAAVTDTTATAGAASALPAAPAGYMRFALNGTTVRIPYYS
jgi:hypothetical protein